MLILYLSGMRILQILLVLRVGGVGVLRSEVLFVLKYYNAKRFTHISVCRKVVPIRQLQSIPVKWFSVIKKNSSIHLI